MFVCVCVCERDELKDLNVTNYLQILQTLTDLKVLKVINYLQILQSLQFSSWTSQFWIEGNWGEVLPSIQIWDGDKSEN